MDKDKAALRRTLRLRRRQFVEQAGPAMLRLHAIAIARIALVAAGAPKSLAAYVGDGREVDPLPALELACAQGIVTALPHLDDRDGPMRFLAWRPGDPLVPGPYGIAQPHPQAPEIEPAAILTPLVGFDRAGRRLGQGGGFYDRAFARHATARRIGLAWSVQEVATVPTEDWDLPLDAIVTEREWIRPA